MKDLFYKLLFFGLPLWLNKLREKKWIIKVIGKKEKRT